MGQQTGRTTVSYDGKKLRSKKGATIQLGGITRKNNGVTDQGEFFYQEEEIPCEIKCTMIHMSDTEDVELRNVKNADVQFECDTGKVYNCSGGVFVEFGELNNGELPVTFAGKAPNKG